MKFECKIVLSYSCINGKQTLNDVLEIQENTLPLRILSTNTDTLYWTIFS